MRRVLNVKGSGCTGHFRVESTLGSGSGVVGDLLSDPSQSSYVHGDAEGEEGDVEGCRLNSTCRDPIAAMI